MRKLLVVAVLLVGSAALGATVLREPLAEAASPFTNVIVSNPATNPVPVAEQNVDGSGNVKVHEQGTANVNVTNGSLAAAQSGTWNVGLSGTPGVTSADSTTLVGSYTGAPDGGGAFTEAVDADISKYKTIRVMANCFAGGACGNIAVNVYAIVGNRSYLIDTFPMQNFLSQTRLLDTLGSSIAVQLQNNNAGSIPNIGVAVFGRAN
jgi:hypothetical protein